MKADADASAARRASWLEEGEREKQAALDKERERVEEQERLEKARAGASFSLTLHCRALVSA